MREILFRGKMGKGDWIYGCYVLTPDDGPVIMTCADWGGKFSHPVIPITVGQFTGRCDKNGVKIFEGDIVTYPDGDGGYEYCDETINSGVVTWCDESALFYITNNYSAEFPDMWDRVDEMEVIGNIHDNPELAKEESK